MKKLVFAIGTIIVLAFSISQGYAQEVTALKLFLEGKQLISENDFDSMSSTKEGLEAGIAKLLKAIELGYQDQKEAYKILAGAYNEMAFVFVADDKMKKKGMLEERDKIYRKLYEMYPDDVDVLSSYTKTLNTDDEKFIVFKKILEIDPKRNSARYVIGAILTKKGQIEQGIEEMKNAILLEDNVPALGLRVGSFLNFLRENLKEQGYSCKIDTEHLLLSEIEIIERLYRLKENSPGVRQAVADFKENFKKVLSKHKCTAIPPPKRGKNR